MRNENREKKAPEMKTKISAILLIVLLIGFAAGIPLNLRAEEQPKKVPVTVKADKLDYDRTNDVYIAEGNVKVEQDGLRVEADKIVLNNKTGHALAEGNVYLQDKGDIIRADTVQINVNTKAGLIYNGDLFMQKENLHLKGERIERKSETVYHIENGTFTTCDLGEWYLRADEIDVDMDRYAVGRGVSFNMIGLPVLYTPYLLFPVRRQTGLLIPEFGYKSDQGFTLKNYFFWALSDHQDMTFYSDYRSRFGHGTGVEYRYINSRDSAGTFFYNYFNTFNQYRMAESPDGRWLLEYSHHEEIADDLSVRADINLVSDYAYFLDLERKLTLRSQPYLDSNLFYVERWDTSSLYVLGQYAIDLTQKENENTIQKMPELRYNIFEESIAGPLHLNFEGSAANFSRQKGDDVLRADFNPRLSAVFGSGGVTLTPRLGVRATYYDRSANSSEPAERTYYYAGADLNARLSRVFGKDEESGFGRIRHSIEPNVSYSYIPRIDQTDLLQLDAIDAVVAQNIVTFSLINRLTAHYKDGSGFKSFDMVFFRLSESYDLDKARSEDTAVAALARSDIIAELFIKTPRLLTFSATEVYNTYKDAFTSSTISAHVRTENGKLNVSHRYYRPEPEKRTEFLILGGGTKIGRWDMDAQFWYDMVQKEATQQEYKLLYASQCWGLGVQYITRQPKEVEWLFMLELKGLGALKF